MADSSSTLSVLDMIAKKHLHCFLCRHQFTEPKMLDCLHCFCLKCLRPVYQKRSVQDNKLSCPKCQKQTILKATGVTELPTDFKLTALLTDINEHTCKRKLQEDPGKVGKCGQHTNKDLVNYCNQCKQLICTTCIIKTHRYHSLTDLPEALDTCKQQVEELAEKIARNKTDLSVLRIEAKKLLGELHTTSKEISTKADKEVARVREEEQKQKQNVQQISQGGIKTYETVHAAFMKEISTAKAKLDEVDQLMAQRSCCEILDVIEEHFQSLKGHTEMQQQRVHQRTLFTCFEDGEKSLERLMLQNQSMPEEDIPLLEIRKLPTTRKMWKIDTTVMESEPGKLEFKIAFHIAALSSNKLVVADIGQKALTLLSSVSSGQYFPERLQIKDLHNPRHVAKGKNGHLVVLDGDIIKIFDKYNLLHQFKPGKGYDQGPWLDTGLFSDRRPTCLTVDDTNQIAVGYSGNGEVSLHESNGSLIRKLCAPMIGEYLTTYKQQLIYTNEQQKKLISVDYKGIMVYSVDVNQPGKPCGVSCDEDGSIFVAVWKGQTSGEIQQYSSDGEYIGCVIKDCGSVYDITLTPYGKLVAAVGKSVKIYQRDQIQYTEEGLP